MITLIRISWLGVLGVGRVKEHAQGQGVHRPLDQGHQLLQGGAGPGAGLQDQFLYGPVVRGRLILPVHKLKLPVDYLFKAK